ncbi:MAG: hypothetical protein QNK37_19685 [Acidobacteriota bacterium]|nr:hypothetical protein [Acidobacteriota bacterium]
MSKELLREYGRALSVEGLVDYFTDCLKNNPDSSDQLFNSVSKVMAANMTPEQKAALIQMLSRESGDAG